MAFILRLILPAIAGKNEVNLLPVILSHNSQTGRHQQHRGKMSCEARSLVEKKKRHTRLGLR